MKKTLTHILLPVFLAFLCADLSSLYLKSVLIPEEIPEIKLEKKETYKVSYSSLENTNFLSSSRKIPLSLSELSPSELKITGTPTKSSLPYKVIGTIVHKNPKKSLVSLKIGSEIMPYTVGDNVKNRMDILRIERKKVIFINAQTKRLEFLEIPEKKFKAFSRSKSRARSTFYPQASSAQAKKFSIKKSWFNDKVKDLSSILRQAKVVPAKDKDGNIKGFQFVSIKAGSDFSKIGFLKGDIILKVNGDPVTNPNQGIELFNKYKDSDQVRISIERNGQMKDFEYTLNE